MPHVQIRFHPAAAAEVEAAVQWYAERSPIAADAFAAEVSRSRVHYLVRSNSCDPSIPREVYGVKCEHVSNAVHFHQGHKSSIVHLNAHNTMSHDQPLLSKV